MPSTDGVCVARTWRRNARSANIVRKVIAPVGDVMLFGLLGPLQVIENGQKIVVSAAKQRVLLAALLVRPGQVLSSARLSELVWDGAPPPRSEVTLRSYVMRLRQALGAAASRVSAASRHALRGVVPFRNGSATCWRVARGS